MGISSCTRRQFRHGVLCGRLRNEAHGSGVGTLFRFSQAKRPLSKLISFPYAIICARFQNVSHMGAGCIGSNETVEEVAFQEFCISLGMFFIFIHQGLHACSTYDQREIRGMIAFVGKRSRPAARDLQLGLCLLLQLNVRPVRLIQSVACCWASWFPRRPTPDGEGWICGNATFDPWASSLAWNLKREHQTAFGHK